MDCPQFGFTRYSWKTDCKLVPLTQVSKLLLIWYTPLQANKEEEDQFLAPSLDYVQVADCQKRPLEGSEDKTVIDFLYVLNLEGPNSIVTQISDAAWRVYEGLTANVTTTRRRLVLTTRTAWQVFSLMTIASLLVFQYQVGQARPHFRLLPVHCILQHRKG